MPDNALETLGVVITWAGMPIWLPWHYGVVLPIQKSVSVWERYIGPVKEVPMPPALPERKGPRRAISEERLRAEASAEEKTTTPLQRPLSSSDGQKESKKPVAAPCAFWRLPYDLRLIIWRELLTPQPREYMKTLPGRFATPHLEILALRQRPRAKCDRLRVHSLDKELQIDPTVLRLSRQFYLEGADILYRENSFVVDSESALISLTRQVAPSRLAQIQDLKFCVDHQALNPWPHRKSLTFNSEAWEEACRCLQQFTGLKSLRIGIGIQHMAIIDRCHSDPAWGQRFFIRILQPLETIKVLDGGSFVVGCTWRKGICDTWPRGSFTIQHIPGTLDW